jgi:hypothetical protein
MEGWIMTDIRMSAMAGVPFGTSLTRPTSPQIGQTFYNGTLGVQEIYTSSGWLPATGANDFNVTLNGTVTTATFTKEYFSGAYTIASSLLDSSYDIYVYDTAGTQVGYTKSPSLNATGNFNKIVIIGGTQGDLLSFSYKTTFTAANTTAEITAGAFVTSVTPTALNSIDDTTVVSGGNFASNVAVYFMGSDNIERAAKSVVRSSSSSLIVTRPDNFPTTLGSYKVIVENPGITRPTGSSLHILNNAVTAGTTPNWTTSAALPAYDVNSAYSTTLLATDSESTDIDYSIIAGTLPTGLSLNQETGVISGTATLKEVKVFTIRAVDAGGNTIDREFTMLPNIGTQAAPAINGVELWDYGYRTSGLYYVSTSQGTKQVYVDLSTVDPTTGKAGWMLVGSWSQASRWSIQATTDGGVFDGTTPRNCFSANFGTMDTKFVRFQVSSSVSSSGVNASSADFYHYASTATPWREWWVTDSSNNINWSTTVNKNQSNVYVDTFRESMRQFSHSYNLKYSYQVNQVWNNLSDGGSAPKQGIQGDWWNGLNGTATGIGWNAAGDGSIAILPQGSSSTGAGQDCNEAQTKFGADDNSAIGAEPNCKVYGDSATYNMNAQTGAFGSDTNLWMWIK